MTTDELKTILEGYARQAAGNVTPPPEIRVEVDEFERTLSADVDYLFDEGDPTAHKAASRALRELQRVVQRDKRMEWDATGEGPDVLGISVVVDLDEDD